MTGGMKKIGNCGIPEKMTKRGSLIIDQGPGEEAFFVPILLKIGSPLSSGCNTKFCHRDYVLKYVVIGEKRTFRKNRDFFGTYSGADRDLLSLFAPKCRIA